VAAGPSPTPLPRLWCLTRGVRGAADDVALAHAPLWGVSRILAGEHPEFWGGLVDVAPDVADPAGVVLGLLRTAVGEDVVSVTDDGVRAARLRRARPGSGHPGLVCRQSGTYLVTGGLGALGLEAAQFLVDHGARRLLLVGRRGLPPRAGWNDVRDATVQRAVERVRALEAQGVTVVTLAVDVADADGMAAAVDPATHGLPPVQGVVHAAGVTHDAMFAATDLAGLREVLSPKAVGAMVLHRLFPVGSLDFFVMFSSCGQFARLTGQTGYAAANCFLDALAAHRRSAGCETRSIGWTAWEGVGMSESIGTTMLEANARGLGAVSVTEALQAWGIAGRVGSAYQAVLRVLPLPADAGRVPMFRGLVETDAAAAQAAARTDPRREWTALPPEKLRGQVATEVRQQITAELQLPEDELDDRVPLIELGLDSVMTAGLRARLRRSFGLDLPPTILWSRPTAEALSEHVVDLLAAAVEPAGVVGAR
jgi:NAD(P)-dependent dehydrogenase (short-subunit alcohol dehydrogenase family)/aryl carrier-like protein